MSHDGSSAKSYIRHPTEKERLDNLAFASFPEDYLPYAAAPGHQRGAVPPPYLLWGEDRRRRPTVRRRKPKCAGALLCAIALVVVAILAVVAISVYLGVVTNLFRSPVVSVSGRFSSSETFSEELFNSSSPQFLERAEFFQSKVEKAFLSSSLEPAFIAARIYSFRPGLVVFFRVYLDRRKLLKDEGESPPTDLVRELVAQRLTEDPESVHVEENEELLAVEHRTLEKRPTILTTAKSTPEVQNPRPNLPPSGAGGVGEWRPVPIEDSVKPSFADRSQGSGGIASSPEESSRKNPADGFGAVRVREDPPPQNPALPGNPRESVGSVHVVDESSVRNPQLINRREGTGTVRLFDRPPTEHYGNLPEGVGTVRVLEDTPQKVSKLPESLIEGVGSVRLIDEVPKKNVQVPAESRAGVGFIRGPEEIPNRKPPPVFGRPAEGSESVRIMEEPPTLAPFVSLVIRNKSRSDKPRNLTTNFGRDQKNADHPIKQHVGVGSIREIITEVDGFPLPPLREAPIVASRLLDLGLRETTESAPTEEMVITSEIKTAESASTEEMVTTSETETTEPASTEEMVTTSEIKTTKSASTEERITTSEISDNNRTKFSESSTQITLLVQNDQELILLSKSEEELNNQDLVQNGYASETKLSTSLHSTLQTEDVATTQEQTNDIKISSLESILFSHRTTSAFTTTLPVNNSDIWTEKVSYGYVDTTMDNDEYSQTSPSIAIIASTNEPEESFVSTSSEVSDSEDSVPSIVNQSMYPNPEPHYHTVEKERNAPSEEPFELHTRKGHGFHQPWNTSHLMKNLTSEEDLFSSPANSSTEQDSLQKHTEEVISEQFNYDKVTEEHTELLEDFSIDDSETFSNASVSDTEIWSEVADVANVTTEDNSQQPKVVPQLQSDLISNDIGDGESAEEENKRFEDEILRHITTLGPQQGGTVINVQACPTGSVPCDVSGDGCGVRCDLRKDCPDNEDERDCTCSDLLRAMGQFQKVCDGVDDCSDGTDEEQCPWCPSTGHFRCPGSRTCINLDLVCDGKEDCPGAHDERRCVSLADSSKDAEYFEYRPQGYLVVRRRGRWGKLCLDSLGRSTDLERRTRELGRAVCSALTYRNMSFSVRAHDETESEDSYYQISPTSTNNRSSSATSLFEPSFCEGKEVLRVQCHSLECGLRPSVSPSQRRRIVGGRSADGAGAWPWAAALYREGDFQCGAALINDQWLVSAAHCFYSSQGAYWTARLGVLRRGSELPSGSEQVRRIQDIILHPQYEDVGFINDIALLKMDRTVPFSDSLRPICLPSNSGEDASMWHGRRCSVVGWGKLYEIGHTFPDSLQEVRLPVISSAECQRRSLFLPAYRITPNMFCAGFERGGRDACLGDSGGPMACQRPADGRWLLLGVTSNGDGCGRPNRPGVYTQVASYLAWIQEIIPKHNASNGITGSESTCAGGVRCRLGRCISRTRVCDGRRDCASGEDEDGC